MKSLIVYGSIILVNIVAWNLPSERWGRYLTDILSTCLYLGAGLAIMVYAGGSWGGWLSFLLGVSWMFYKENVIQPMPKNGFDWGKWFKIGLASALFGTMAVLMVLRNGLL